MSSPLQNLAFTGIGTFHALHHTQLLDTSAFVAPNGRDGSDDAAFAATTRTQHATCAACSAEGRHEVAMVGAEGLAGARPSNCG